MSSRWNRTEVNLRITLGQKDFDLVDEDLVYKTDIKKSGPFLKPDFPEIGLDGIPRATLHPYTKNKDPRFSIELKPFHTDLSSEPWAIGWRLDRQEYMIPALLHDYMLQHRDQFPEFSRKDIDRVYREALEDQGIGEYECKIRYAGVRANSWLREERFG